MTTIARNRILQKASPVGLIRAAAKDFTPQTVDAELATLTRSKVPVERGVGAILRANHSIHVNLRDSPYQFVELGMRRPPSAAGSENLEIEAISTMNHSASLDDPDANGKS